MFSKNKNKKRIRDGEKKEMEVREREKGKEGGIEEGESNDIEKEVGRKEHMNMWGDKREGKEGEAGRDKEEKVRRLIM